MEVRSEETREQLQKRLRRIEGQVKGVARMLDEGRDCREIIQQLSAVRAAVHQASLEVMRTYATQCMADTDNRPSDDEMLDYIISTLGKWA